VIPAFTARALAGEPLTIAGDGSQSRRFVYVEDLADSVVRALTPAAANQTYNLVGTDDTTVREIALAVREAIGEVEIVHGPGRTGDFAGAPVSAERAACDLGWRATTPFAEGMRRYVEWHRSAAPAPAPRASVLAGVARRGALSLAWAFLTAVMVIGLATLTPVDRDMDTYDTFLNTLLLMVPLVLAGGFRWDEPLGGHLRTGLWAAAVVCLAIALLPWPGVVGNLHHGHPALLVLFALALVVAAWLTALRPPLPAWLGASGE
jgi:hypothetical protein